VPEKIPSDGREAKEAASRRYHQEHGPSIDIRQHTYLHNRVAQDHRAVKRSTRPMLGCKSLAAAHATLVGIALLPRLKKRQLVSEEGGEGRTAAAPCYALAA
jgi:putative transposase